MIFAAHEDGMYVDHSGWDDAPWQMESHGQREEGRIWLVTEHRHHIREHLNTAEGG